MKLTQPASPTDFTTCRTFGHAWEVDKTYRDEDDDAQHPLVHLELKCLRCSMQRFDMVTTRGVLFRRHYRYPENYLTPKGTPRPKRDEWRLRLLAQRLVETRGRIEFRK